MLVIREEQMRILLESVFDRFVGQMIAHLRKFFPEHTRDKTDDIMRETVCQGVRDAEKYGITAGHDICLFTDLTVLFGSGFDEDPELPWVKETLSAQYPNAAEKIKGLHEAAILHLQSNADPTHKDLASAGADAYRNFSDLPVAGRSHAPIPSPGN